MKAEFQQTYNGQWYWVITKDSRWVAESTVFYSRRRDAKRGLLRFLATEIEVEG